MFKLDWGTYLTTTENVIYAVIDGRGSGYRGDDLLHELYYNLGGPEVIDQIDVTRQLLKRYSFIDKTKVAIWGWSYGGKGPFINDVMQISLNLSLGLFIYYVTQFWPKFDPSPPPLRNTKMTI